MNLFFLVGLEGLVGRQLGFLVGGSSGAGSLSDLKNHSVICLVSELVAGWDPGLMDGSTTVSVVFWAPTRSSTR